MEHPRRMKPDHGTTDFKALNSEPNPASRFRLHHPNHQPWPTSRDATGTETIPLTAESSTPGPVIACKTSRTKESISNPPHLGGMGSTRKGPRNPAFARRRACGEWGLRAT